MILNVFVYLVLSIDFSTSLFLLDPVKVKIKEIPAK